MIWRKPLAFAAGAGSYKYIVWVFNGRFAISSLEPCQLPSFVEKESLGTAESYYSAQKKSCSYENCSHRTRDSVRRVSGFVQISVTLTDLPHHDEQLYFIETMFVAAASPEVQTWGKWVFLLMASHAFYSIFNEKQRNLFYGEFYKLRFMKRQGFPASIRTAFLAFVLWSFAFLSFFHAQFWDWDYSGILFLSGFGTVMLSSYLDARSARNQA